MRIAYFDCPTGISGNMILGALIDAGLDADFLKNELEKLQITKTKSQTNYKLQITKTKKHGIKGTHLKVKIKGKEKSRQLNDILTIIKMSKLSKKVKTLSSRIFQRLAEAEAKVHGEPIEQVHFHEVGAVDAIIDIVGSVIGFEKLGIEKNYCSPLPFTNPAPATMELLKGVPTYGVNIKGELVTPTGAAIISTLAESFGDIPRMKAEKIGYGAGTFNLPLPNLLRVFIGEAEIQTERDAVLQIETNIDDMNPKLYPKVIQKLMGAGALDAYIHPILMKKNRRAINLTVLCDPERRERIIEEIFNQTTTLGVRTYLVPREKLTRKLVSVRTKYGKARVKLGFLGKELKTAAPEYEDYKKLSVKHHLPTQTIYKVLQKISFALLLLVALQFQALARSEVNLSFTRPQNAPYFIGIPEINIDAEEFATVILKMKSNQSGTARLFWATNFDPQMNEPKSVWFFLDKSKDFKEYVFNLRQQNPYWAGFVGQVLIYPDTGPEAIEIESAKAIPGNLMTNIKSGWREFFVYEAPQLRTVNFIYGPKINGMSVNVYIYWLIILISAGVAAYAFYKKLPWQTAARNIVIIALFFWTALDMRHLLDQGRTVALDWRTFAGKSLDAKRELTTFGDFYGFLQFAKAKLPEGSAFNILHAPGYYYLEKANYYLYPTHYDKNGRYLLVYDPSRTVAVPAGAKLVATYKEGEYILKK